MSEPDPVYVDRPAALARLVDILLDEPAIALDTEANSMFAFRERTCLVQVATRRQTFLVDPLAPLDLRPLAPVLADPAIVKVLHGAEFDVLMLKRAGPFEVAGLFDTRVAAASLGLGSSSLAALVSDVVGIELDKRYQRSDWGERPLSAGQRRYAAQDVCHLLEVADVLRERLHQAGFPHPEEVAAECRRIEALEPAPPRADRRSMGASQGRDRTRRPRATHPRGHRPVAAGDGEASGRAAVQGARQRRAPASRGRATAVWPRGRGDAAAAAGDASDRSAPRPAG